LTWGKSNAALRLLQMRWVGCLAYNKGIVEAILQSFEGDVREIAHGRLSNYVKLLASTDKSEEQLVALGKAYLDEILNPDPRYSGC
jgi:hypothetical protein